MFRKTFINYLQRLRIMENSGNKRVSTGSVIFDRLLQGGFETDTVSTIYGPAGCGKSNICIIAAVSITRSGKKVIYIDTEGGFSVSRMQQIAPDDYKILMDRIIFLQPTSFAEQRKAFGSLSKLIDTDIGMIIVDTVSMLYRLEIGKTNDVYSVNRELGEQLSYLNELTRRKDIPVLVTNQVYSGFNQGENIKLVGGDILKYQSKCLVELQKGHSGVRKAILRKHRSIAEDRTEVFKIVDGGFSR